MNFIYGLILGLLILPAVFGVPALHRRWQSWILTRKQRILDEAFPTWRNTVNSRKFAEWYTAQPRETQTLGESWGTKDAIEVLRRYEAFTK